jgi:aminomethyltransferase
LLRKGARQHINKGGFSIMDSMDTLKKTPLFDAHIALGGKMVDFGGWALPVQYSSILEEHKAVREACGLFDVSHMGEVFVTGPDSLAFLQNLLTNDFTNMTPGRCRYSVMCYPDGGSVDDVLVCKFADEEYLVVVNASNTDKDYAWMQEHAAGYNIQLKNDSANWAQLALQGPKAEAILAPLCDGALPAKYYTFVPELTVCGIKALVSRTGYTGEDGFELLLRRQRRREAACRAAQSGSRRRTPRCPARSARATRCALKPACRCTATN